MLKFRTKGVQRFRRSYFLNQSHHYSIHLNTWNLCMSLLELIACLYAFEALSEYM